MSREDIQKLLGGYATDTLSQAERQALFEAAVEDQELFDALAKEQALRDVLQQPLARQQLLDVLGPAQAPARRGFRHWLRQPAVLAMAGGVAVLAIVAGLAWLRTDTLVPDTLVHKQYAVVQTPLRKEFVLRAPLRQTPPQVVLPKPPILVPQPQMAEAMLPTATPVRPKANEPTLARLAQSTHSADLARQLYSRSDPAMGSSAGALARMRATVAPAAASPVRHLGVRYGLLLKGADGEYAPARLDTEFHMGDSVRLRLEPNDNGYLYLFDRDATGGWHLASTQRALRGQPCLLPASGALQYGQPGRKELLVILLPSEQPSLTNLESAELDALAASARGDILTATVPGSESAYVVDARVQAGRQEVVFKIMLAFR